MTWKEPTSGDAVTYTILRARAVANPAGSVIAVVTQAGGLPVALAVDVTTTLTVIGTTTPPTTTFTDHEELPNGQYFVYVVTVTYGSGLTETISPSLQLRRGAGDQRSAGGHRRFADDQ